MKLSRENIKEIKHLKKMGIILPILIILITTLVSVGYMFDPNKSLYLILSGYIGILALCIIINYSLNRKYSKDINAGIKEIRIAVVSAKESKTSYEAGSGAMYVPALGDIFPKLWGQKMKPSELSYLIIDNVRQEVEKDTFDKIKEGDSVEMHYTKHSNTLLGIEAHKA